MPTCSGCQRRVWVWQADLFGRRCTRCRTEDAVARTTAAREREATRRAAFEQSNALRRAWLGASRGAFLGTAGLLAIGASLLALTNDAGGQYPFAKLSAWWVLVSLVAVLLAVLIGWWFSSWWIGALCFLGLGALGGATIGTVQGLRRRWDVFG